MPAKTRPNGPNAASFGTVPVARFLRDFWQKRPLLIRRAFDEFKPLVSLAELTALAQRDDVESRLVTSFGGRWNLVAGPLARLPARRRDWTLLVQGVNLYVPAIDELLHQFAFLPYTRLDDIMVSYAADNGSVGPHFDSYDVFLLQAEGRRRWRIGGADALELVDDVPLKILKNFAPDSEWVLEPGDMLYLPPHIAHEGVALGACTTYSIGFRAPTFTELAREFLLDRSEATTLPGRYQDATRKATAEPAEIDQSLLEQLSEQFARIRWTSEDIELFAGRYFSDPKAQVFFEPPTRPSRARFRAGALKDGLIVDPKTRLLYRGENFYINGETLGVGRRARGWLAEFANARSAGASACQAAFEHEDLALLLFEWFRAGWITKGGKSRVAN